MLLTPRAEYALRALAVLALEPSDAWLPAKDLAERAHVPPAFLSKVMRRFVLADLARAQKGHGGGFQLARAPQRIRVCDVLAAMDFEMVADHCAFGWQKCNEVRPCPLHGMYSLLKADFRQWAERSTLAVVEASALRRPQRGKPALRKPR